MKKFDFKYINDENGMHARPAGRLVKKASDFNSDIKIICGSEFANAKQLIPLIKMGIKYNDDITVTIDGEDEIQAEQSLKSFFGIV